MFSSHKGVDAAFVKWQIILYFLWHVLVFIVFCLMW